jgi:RNA polymerase sigma-70 factor (ECF subfamily)
MARVFTALRPEQRQLVWLAYVEGASHKEIGAAIGVRERSVRVLLHRAKRKLAALLGEAGFGGCDPSGAEGLRRGGEA